MKPRFGSSEKSIDKSLAGLTSKKIEDPNDENQKQPRGHYYQV